MQKEKKGFFRDVLKSIKDFDRYEDFALAPTSNAMKYLLIIILFISIIVYGLFLYKFSISDEEGINFFKENILNINYEQEEFPIEGFNDIVVQNKNNTVIPVWIYVLYFSTSIVDTVILAALGYIIARIARIKIPYKACFNMAIHALTLSIILEMIYIPIHSFAGFEIKYFNWMYTTVSYVYMIVAILMIKTDIIGRQMELIRLEQEQQKVREEMQNQDDEEENNKEEKKDNKDKEKDDKKEESPNEDNNLEGELGT